MVIIIYKLHYFLLYCQVWAIEETTIVQKQHKWPYHNTSWRLGVWWTFIQNLFYFWKQHIFRRMIDVTQNTSIWCYTPELHIIVTKRKKETNWKMFEGIYANKGQASTWLIDFVLYHESFDPNSNISLPYFMFTN